MTMLTIQEQAVETFNNALKYVATYIPSVAPDDLKKAAKICAINQTRRQRDALYLCSMIDDFVPHKTIDFYKSVEEIIEKNF